MPWKAASSCCSRWSAPLVLRSCCPRHALHGSVACNPPRHLSGVVLTLPYGKFAHGIFRSAALLKFNFEKRKPIQGDVHHSCVFREGYSIGRIRFAKERIGHSPGWDWHVNPPLPVGAEETLEAAIASFRDAWVWFYATLAPSDIDHWHNTVEGLLECERNRSKPPKPYSSMMRCVWHQIR